MFEKIIMDSDLIPLREAAEAGDLDAMLALARKVMDGDGVKFCLKTSRELFDKINAHEAIEDSPHHMKLLCQILADHAYELMEQGEITVNESREIRRDLHQQCIYWSAEQPFNEWDIDEMKRIMDWLYEDLVTPMNVE